MPPLPSLFERVWSLLRHGRWPRTIHVTVPSDQQAVAFAAGQDGLKAGDRIVVHWEPRDLDA